MSDVITVTNPSYVEFLQTTTGRTIAEQAQQITALSAALAIERGKLEKADAENDRLTARVSRLQAALDEIVSMGTSVAARDNGHNYLANRMYHIADKARSAADRGCSTGEALARLHPTSGKQAL